MKASRKKRKPIPAGKGVIDRESQENERSFLMVVVRSLIQKYHRKKASPTRKK